MKYLKQKIMLLTFGLFGVALFVGLLIACGGGGGGDGTSSLTDTTTPAAQPDIAQPSSQVLSSFISAVKSDDQDAIEKAFVPESWTDSFKEVFGSTNTDLESLGSDLTKAVLVKETDTTAIYRIFRVEDGVDRAFDMIMIKVNGEWKIFSM